MKNAHHNFLGPLSSYSLFCSSNRTNPTNIHCTKTNSYQVCIKKRLKLSYWLFYLLTIKRPQGYKNLCRLTLEDKWNNIFTYWCYFHWLFASQLFSSYNWLADECVKIVTFSMHNRPKEEIVLFENPRIRAAESNECAAFLAWKWTKWLINDQNKWQLFFCRSANWWSNGGTTHESFQLIISAPV